jgi:gluconate 5-dehydrogenase
MSKQFLKHPKELFDLTGHIAVVTGASSGLGRRGASVLSAAGARVVGVARRIELLLEWKDEVGGAAKAAVVAHDLGNRALIADLAEKVSEPFGAPDIVVHAAGINTRQVADEVTPEGWDLSMNLNLGAPFFLSQALVNRGMKEKQWGRIVTFGSLQTTRAFPGGVAYGTTKAGIAQMTRAMAEAWSRHGITANCIGPGFFPTELTNAVFSDEERAARYASQTCIGRNGEMSDLDGPLLFLCSDASSYVTGQVLMVDGGFTAK